MIFLSIISTIFLINLGILQGQTVKKSRTEKFVQIVEGKVINHIDITYGKHATTGVFYGFDTLKDGNLIYFSAPLKKLKIKKGDISFEVVAYSFSNEPFDKKNSYHNHYDVESLKLPLLLSFSQHFFGKKSSNKLVLLRTLDVYFNRADELTFTRVL